MRDLARTLLGVALSASSLAAQSLTLHARGPAPGVPTTDPVPVEVFLPPRPYPIADPSSLRVVSVEIPAPVVAQGGSFYLAERGPWSVLGPRAGLLEAGDSVSLVYTLAVPALALAGENQAGLVRFVTASLDRAIDVPVMVDVTGRVALTVESERPVLGGHAGERVRTTVRLQNSGNVPATVALRFTGPSGWDSRIVSAGVVVVPRGGAYDVPVEIRIPHDAGYGDFAIGVAASIEGSRVGGASLGVRVARPTFGQSGGAPYSVADLSFGAAQDNAGQTFRAFTAQVQTALPGEIQASGRYSDGQRNISGLSANSMGRLGFSRQNYQIRLNAPVWQAVLGNVGGRSDGLAGYALFGDGADVSLSTDRWKGHGLMLTPVARDGGRYLMAGGSRKIHGAWVGVEMGDLSDGLYGDRFARTIAASVSGATPYVDSRLQVGHRETSFGSGVAWTLDLDRKTENWGAGLSLGQSPGGAAAFARAESEYSAEAFGRLTPNVSVGGSFWGNADGAATARPFRSSGWNGRASTKLSDRTSVDTELRHNRWTSENPLGDVASGTTQLSTTLMTSVGRWQVRAGLRGGEVTRLAELAGLGTTRSSAPQWSMHGGVGLVLRQATLSADVAHDASGAGVGLPSSQTSLSLRADRIPVWRDLVYGYAEYSRFTLNASGAALDAQIAGIEVRLPAEFALTLDGSRNALMYSASGGAPWVLAMRLRRAIGFAGWGAGGESGVVFVDDNLNGRRDRGERGLAGVMVEGESELAMTDRRGNYQLRRSTVLPRVDARSLPSGFLVGPTTRTDRSRDLAVLPIAPVEIRVTIDNPDRLPLERESLEKIIISLTDSRGRLWTNTADTNGVARFDALPAGSYRVDVDASAVGEPLAPVETPPTVRVEGGAGRQRITIILAPRRVRLQPVPAGRRLQIDGGRGLGISPP